MQILGSVIVNCSTACSYNIIIISLSNSLFSGFVPRVCWIAMGGFIFLGAYEKTRDTMLIT